jgi:hypothetical protein
MALYKMFADPFNTAGLVIDSKMHQGFVFEVYDPASRPHDAAHGGTLSDWQEFLSRPTHEPFRRTWRSVPIVNVTDHGDRAGRVVQHGCRYRAKASAPSVIAVVAADDGQLCGACCGKQRLRRLGRNQMAGNREVFVLAAVVVQDLLHGMGIRIGPSMDSQDVCSTP